VAALVAGAEQCQFEGQPAMLLEAACDGLAGGQYDMAIQPGRTQQLDWRPLVRQLLRDRAAGTLPGAMAMRFHRGLAAAVVDVCRCHRSLPVVLGGGVFQNRVLVELLAERFAETGQSLLLPSLIPPNDGGLAAGQLAVAAAWVRERRTR
jgi:hydrogenase maturation protein HypF